MNSCAIIIPTCPMYSIWLSDLLASIRTRFPIVIAQNPDVGSQYEGRAVVMGIECGFDEFFILPDTCSVLDNSIFDVLFHLHTGRGAFMNPEGKCFTNKYVRRELLECNLNPLYSIASKSDGVCVETVLHREYAAKFGPVILDRCFVDNPRREFKHGRENMVLENRWLKKYKGCWSERMIGAADAYVPPPVEK